MRFQSPYLPSDICILSGRKFWRNYFISLVRIEVSCKCRKKQQLKYSKIQAWHYNIIGINEIRLIPWYVLAPTQSSCFSIWHLFVCLSCSNQLIVVHMYYGTVFLCSYESLVAGQYVGQLRIVLSGRLLNSVRSARAPLTGSSTAQQGKSWRQ